MAALCDPRTVKARLAGKPVQSTSAIRIDQALKSLGLAVFLVLFFGCGVDKTPEVDDDMAVLQKTNVSVLFKGLNQKSPGTIGAPGTLEVAENVVIKRADPGQIQIERRNGLVEVADTVRGSGFRMVSYGDALVVQTLDTIERYSVTAQAFKAATPALGSFTAPAIRVTRSDFQVPFIGSPGAQTPTQDTIDVAYFQNTACYVWIDNSATLRYIVTDGVTRTPLASGPIPGGTQSNSRVVQLGGVFYVFWKDANAIKATTINATTLVVAATTTVIAAGSALAGTNYDVQTGFDTTHIALMYRIDGTHHGRALLSTAFAVTTSVSDATAADQPDVAMCWCQQNVFGASLFYGTVNAASGVKVQTIDKATLAITATNSTPTPPAQVVGVENMTGFVIGGIPDVLIEYNFVDSVGVSHRGIKHGGGFNVSFSSGLASRAFYVNGVPYVATIYNSTQLAGSVVKPQATYFLTKFDFFGSSGTVVGKILPSQAGTFTSFALSSAVVDASGVVHVVGKHSVSDDTVAGVLIAQYGLTDMAISASSPVVGTPLAFGGVALFPGAQLLEMDESPFNADAVHEQGFPLSPEIPVLVEGAAASGSIDPGTRSYIGRWKWVDSNGQSGFSAISTPLAITTVNAGSSVSVSFYGANAYGDRTFVHLEIFRTPINGTGDEYFKVTPPVFLAQTFSGNVVTFVDTASEVALAGGEPFTPSESGGELESVSPTALTDVIEHKNRVFGVDPEQPWRVRFSKEYSAGTSVGFTDGFTLETPQGDGQIYGMASHDGHLLLFKRSSIYVVDGEFPDSTGGAAARAATSIPTPLLLPVGVGSDQPRSIVVSELGVGFYSSLKGFWLLDRSLNPQYIGAPVEATAQGQTVSGATIHPTLPQIRWTTEGGTTFVLDTFFTKQAGFPIWTTFTGQACVASIVHNGDWYLLTSGGKLLKEDLTSWQDGMALNGGAFTAGAPYLAKIKISDINLGGVNGFVRAWRGRLLGEWYSSHKVKITLAMNHRTVAGQVFTYDATIDPDPYLLKFDLREQKNTAIDVTIEDTTDFQGRAFAWSALTFEVGVKPGSLRQGTNRNMTGS